MKSQVLASLPPEGEVTPAGDAVAKLDALAPILAYHGRDSFVELQVILKNRTLRIIETIFYVERSVQEWGSLAVISSRQAPGG
ncbi:MAG: hypothetical protein EHM23_26770 [Acidobacteria bacterium]|nr:MAG: hypothetical protein EHM23_26770 [Acidobacteriota bacterium]